MTDIAVTRFGFIHKKNMVKFGQCLPGFAIPWFTFVSSFPTFAAAAAVAR